jgi:iron complex outermembrane recepter protein
MRRALSLSTSILALACGSAVVAPSLAAAADNSGIETVVVTAERRSENLLTTPVTASVLSGDDLANRGAVTVTDLQFIAPNVTINDFGQGIDFDIRGIGKGEHNSQTPIGVVVYHDGASTFPGYIAAEPFYDIKSVEVYRGPQGTFVGQNATGGAVFVNTNDAVIGGNYDGYAQLQYGNYNNAEIQGAVNIPVSDDFAIRIAGYGMYRDSFYTMIDRDPADACPGHKYVGCKPGYNAADNTWGAGRLSAVWHPTEALTISFKYDALYQDFGASPAIPYTELYPLGALTQPLFVPNPRHNTDLFSVTANAPEGRMDRMQRGILKVDYVFGDGTKLQSITDYNVGNTMWRTDLDLTDYGNPGDINYFAAFPGFGGTNNWTFFDRVDETMYSEEINLVSADNQPITWVVGLYGQQNNYRWIDPYQFWIAVGKRVDNNPIPNAGNFFQFTSYTFQGHTSNLDLAAFGQVEAKLGGGVEASLGGRWTTTRSENVGPFWSYGTFKFNRQGQASSNLSYKAALDWAVNDGNFLYAFVATGYTGGGLNVVFNPAIPQAFGPVTDTNYEAGWKATDWFDGHVHTEVDAYYTEYNHFQVSLEDPAVPATTSEYNLTSPVKNYGIEAEAQASFGQFSGTASIGLLKSELGNFWAIDPRFSGFAPGTCFPTTGGTNPYCKNLKGNPITYAPSVTYNVSAEYRFNLDGGDTLTPRINFAHTSGQWASLFDNPSLGDRLGVRDILGGQLAYTTGAWVWTLYGDNLLDKHYVAAVDSGGLYAAPPRQYGIRLATYF